MDPAKARGLFTEQPQISAQGAALTTVPNEKNINSWDKTKKTPLLQARGPLIPAATAYRYTATPAIESLDAAGHDMCGVGSPLHRAEGRDAATQDVFAAPPVR